MTPIADKYPSNLPKQDIRYIKDILSNDETSSDEQLIKLFMEECNLSEINARVWVGRRSFYLNNIVNI